MSSFKKCETVKLFYDEYPYKLVISNSLAHIFRSKNLAFAKSELDNLQYLYDTGQPLLRKNRYREKTIDPEIFFEARKLYIEFSKHPDFKLRIENPKMQIYSHDYDWLIYMSSNFDNTLEFWEPNNLSILEPKVILVHGPVDFEYKITMDLGVDSALAKWIRENPSKAKAGEVCLQTIETNGFTKGLYFYVRDQKILHLLNLFIGKIQRIDKLVSIAKSDK